MTDDQRIDIADLLRQEIHNERQIVATSIVIGLLIAAVAITSGPAGAAIAATAMTILVITGPVVEEDFSFLFSHAENATQNQDR